MRSAADTLRLIVKNMDNCKENFNDQFSLEELVLIGRVFLACGWDIYPDQWSQRQIGEALQGIIPKWNDDETPDYSEPRERLICT